MPEIFQAIKQLHEEHPKNKEYICALTLYRISVFAQVPSTITTNKSTNGHPSDVFNQERKPTQWPKFLFKCLFHRVFNPSCLLIHKKVLRSKISTCSPKISYVTPDTTSLPTPRRSDRGQANDTIHLFSGGSIALHDGSANVDMGYGTT